MAKKEKEDEVDCSNLIIKMKKERFLTNPSESTLLMVFFEKLEVILLQGQNGDTSTCDLWYLDTSATNHMIEKRDLFFHNNRDVIFEEGHKWE
ncbi:unnamed protein product [Spirodela intermedia]|uniref:Uncharacterized protein n=1 Tax=Spirodela intermedia TaxID=51605 RepID=A0A7I8L872_SPIIN|nr:unnamed protein product [Spirodela intermedia]